MTTPNPITAGELLARVGEFRATYKGEPCTVVHPNGDGLVTVEFPAETVQSYTHGGYVEELARAVVPVASLENVAAVLDDGTELPREDWLSESTNGVSLFHAPGSALEILRQLESVGAPTRPE